jgi:hypothetical protein
MEWIMSKTSIKTSAKSPVLKVKTVAKAGGLAGNHNLRLR